MIVSNVGSQIKTECCSSGLLKALALAVVKSVGFNGNVEFDISTDEVKLEVVELIVR